MQTITIEYSPKWLYSVFKVIKEIPIPLWIFGLAVLVAGISITHVVAWGNGILLGI